MIFAAVISLVSISTVSMFLLRSNPLKIHQYVTCASASRFLSSSKNILNDLDENTNEYLFGQSPTTFDQLKVIPEMWHALQRIGRENATLIQCRAIPKLLEGSDVIISSETGSGKTLAYLIPVIQKCVIRELNLLASNSTSESTDSNLKGQYPQAIILVPNKDLATQVVSMSIPLVTALTEQGFDIKVGSLTKNYGSDRWPLHENCPSVVVCTPAILSNFVRGPVVTDELLFDSIRCLVLDEADMLVEGSYQVHLERILEALKKARRARIRTGLLRPNEHLCQYILSAATMPSYGMRSVKNYMKKNFPNATAISNDYVHRLHPKIEQQFVRVNKDFVSGKGGPVQSRVHGAISENRVVQIAQAILDRAVAEDTGDSSTHHGAITDDISSHYQITKSNENANPTTFTLDDLFADNTPQYENSVNQHTGSSTSTCSALPQITPEIYQRIPHTMVFANEIETVQKLAKNLNRLGLKTVEYHKLLPAGLKDLNVESFQLGESRVMVCTDYASRGLDLPFVKHVVQAEFATNVVQYLHRIGRCSRAGRQGYATNFYDSDSELLVDTIMKNDEPIIEPDSSLVSSTNEDDQQYLLSNFDSDTSTPNTTAEFKSQSAVELHSIATSFPSATKSITHAFSRRRGLRQKNKRSLRSQQQIDLNQHGRGPLVAGPDADIDSLLD